MLRSQPLMFSSFEQKSPAAGNNAKDSRARRKKNNSEHVESKKRALASGHCEERRARHHKQRRQRFNQTRIKLFCVEKMVWVAEAGVRKIRIFVRVSKYQTDAYETGRQSKYKVINVLKKNAKKDCISFSGTRKCWGTATRNVWSGGCNEEYKQ